MIFFDFLFYNIYGFYKGFREKGAESSSATIIGGLLAGNLLTIYFMVLAILADDSKIGNPLIVSLFVIFQALTYIRYIYRKTNSVDVLEKKWLDRSELYRKRSVVFQYVYVITSIISIFGLAIYLGSKR